MDKLDETQAREGLVEAEAAPVAPTMDSAPIDAYGDPTRFRRVEVDGVPYVIRKPGVRLFLAIYKGLPSARIRGVDRPAEGEPETDVPQLDEAGAGDFANGYQIGIELLKKCTVEPRLVELDDESDPVPAGCRDIEDLGVGGFMTLFAAIAEFGGLGKLEDLVRPFARTPPPS